MLSSFSRNNCGTQYVNTFKHVNYNKNGNLLIIKRKVVFVFSFHILSPMRSFLSIDQHQFHDELKIISTAEKI